MIEYTVVLFVEDRDLGIEADNVEVIEDTEDQMVLTATFKMAVEIEAESPEEIAADFLPPADPEETVELPPHLVKEVSVTGTAEGQVVGHSGS